MSIEGVQVKFLGQVSLYNEEKKHGMVHSAEARQLFGEQDVYVYRDILEQCGAQVGDRIRFGMHVNMRGQPQVSLPCFKVEEDGSILNLPEDASFVNAEDVLAEDPAWAESLAAEIQETSARKNNAKKGKGKAKGKGGKEMWGVPASAPIGAASYGCAKGGSYGGDWADPYGGKGFKSAGKDKGKGKPCEENDGTTLFVGGIPMDATERELRGIFRQYAGFKGLNMSVRPTHVLAWASFESAEQAAFVMEALGGYPVDETYPEETQLDLKLARPKTRTC